MVSFQAPFTEAELLNNNQTKIVSEPETSTKKRKCHDTQVDEILPYKHSKAVKSFFSDVQLQHETPLPSEWQRCLDIQSGEIHFYNARTHKRTLRDPRASPEPSTPRDHGHMSLDLELNLPCGSPTSEKTNPLINKKSSKSNTSAATFLFMGISSDEKDRSSETTQPEEATEMVATVCMHCHMLVMLCKSSPTCPNCKLRHPPCQTSADQNVELASLEINHSVIQGRVS